MENKSRQDELRENPNQRQAKSFRCADAGVTNCTWSITGDHEDEIMRKAEQHARDAHGMKGFDDNTRRRVHDAIRDRAA